jgi:hypothetical protein
MNDKSEPVAVSAVSDVALKTVINELEAVIATL